MKITEPKVELWSEEGISAESHIARCSRTCYGREYKEPNQEADKKMVEGLIKRGHLSMLRHASRYMRYDNVQPDTTSDWFEVCPYNNVYHQDSSIYISTNCQEERYGENFNYAYCDKSYSPEEFLDLCKDKPELFYIFRLTFCITTQISTSRELNRVSPNNIAERSSRYCTLKDGLEIVRPWWWNDDDSRRIDKIRYENAINKAEFCYRAMIDDGMKPEDARGILPLDTATKVVYTYSVQEWKHIIDLRYYGTTGRPHPNAKLVIGMVREQINQFAKEHNIDFQV